MLAVLGVALATEAWMRFGVLLWHRRGSDSWHRAWNRLIRWWGVWTARATRASAGLGIEIEGDIPGPGPYLVVSNHQSSLDIPFLILVLRSLDLKFVAHSGLARGKPAVSLALRNGGFGIVEKKNAREDLLRLRRFASELASNHGSPVIFPEGIRTFDGTIGPFHVAGMRTVQERTGLAILPVVHDGLWRARSMGEARRLVGVTLRFRILDPVPAERVAADPRGAYREIEASIRAGLARMRGESVPSEEPQLVEV